MLSMLMDELVQAGLVTESEEPHLSNKGREWLKTLEGVEHQEINVDQAADLVLSTSGLFR